MNLHLFSAYSWMALWSPIWAVIVILAGFIYIRRIKITLYYGIPGWRMALFLIALGLVYVVVGSPFHVIAADDLFSAYLLQLSIVYLVVPPCLILGTPVEWLRPLLWRPAIKKTLSVLTYPWVTAILFNIGLSVYLLPSVFNAVHGHLLYDGLCRAFLFLVAMFMWWSIISPLRELNSLSELNRIFYIFITAIMLTPIAMLMLFANQALYPAYAATPQVFSFLTAEYDQQIGAGILKMFQLSVYGIALGAIIYKWMKNEEEKKPPGEVIPFPVKDHTKSGE